MHMILGRYGSNLGLSRLYRRLKAKAGKVRTVLVDCLNLTPFVAFRFSNKETRGPVPLLSRLCHEVGSSEIFQNHPKSGHSWTLDKLTRQNPADTDLQGWN